MYDVCHEHAVQAAIIGPIFLVLRAEFLNELEFKNTVGRMGPGASFGWSCRSCRRWLTQPEAPCLFEHTEWELASGLSKLKKKKCKKAQPGNYNCSQWGSRTSKGLISQNSSCKTTPRGELDDNSRKQSGHLPNVLLPLELNPKVTGWEYSWPYFVASPMDGKDQFWKG